MNYGKKSPLANVISHLRWISAHHFGQPITSFHLDDDNMTIYLIIMSVAINIAFRLFSNY